MFMRCFYWFSTLYCIIFPVIFPFWLTSCLFQPTTEQSEQVKHKVRTEIHYNKIIRSSVSPISEVHHFIVENPFQRICSAYNLPLSTSSSYSAYLRFRPWSFPVNALENLQSLLRSSPYLSTISQPFRLVLSITDSLLKYNDGAFQHFCNRDLRLKWSGGWTASISIHYALVRSGRKRISSSLYCDPPKYAIMM